MTETAANPFSQRFADRLVAAHPTWHALVRADPEGIPPPGSLQVVVPSPVPSRELRIRTYGNQVTVAFGPDGWHEHFLPDAYGNDRSAHEAALRLINDLVADRTLVTTRYLLGRRLWVRATRADRVRGPRFGTVKVISWSGAWDATLSRPNEELKPTAAPSSLVE